MLCCLPLFGFVLEEACPMETPPPPSVDRVAALIEDMADWAATPPDALTNLFRLLLRQPARTRTAHLAHWAAVYGDGDLDRAWRRLGEVPAGEGMLAYGLFVRAAAVAGASGDQDTAVWLFTKATGAPGEERPPEDVSSEYQAMAPGYETEPQHVKTAQEFLSVIESRPHLVSRKRLLDLCCGSGLIGRRFHDIADTIEGIDLSPAMLAMAGSLGVYDRLHCGDAVAVMATLPPGSWDLITCSFAAYHWRDAAPLYLGAGRLLAPGGRLVICEFACADDHDVRMTHSGTRRFCRSRRHCRDLALAAGLEVEACLSAFPAGLFGLNWIFRKTAATGRRTRPGAQRLGSLTAP